MNKEFMNFSVKGEDVFAEKYANWSRLESVALTFDIDWAPDYMIQNVLDILDQYGVKATFFATHNSPLMQELARNGGHEVGWHINLTKGSTQGNDIYEIIDYLKNSFPAVNGNRFHQLRYAYRDLKDLKGAGLQYDVSTLLYNRSHLLPTWHNDLNMVMLPYLWEDGICENAGHKVGMESISLHTPGLKIINFHPMNVYLNGDTVDTRLSFMKGVTDLTSYPEEKALKFRDASRHGAERVLRTLCEALTGSTVKFYTVFELSSAYMKVLGK